AAHAEPPQRVVCQVVVDDNRLPGFDDTHRRFRNRRLKTSARQSAFVRAIRTNEHMCAFAPVGAPPYAHDRGDRGSFPGSTRLANRLEKLLDLAPIHTPTMARTHQGHNRTVERIPAERKRAAIAPRPELRDGLKAVPYRSSSGCHLRAR